jgi:Kef-type K+ transport system membrane component KefB
MIAHVALVVAIVLVVAKVAGELALRVKQPPVLGELVAGIVLGAIPSQFSRDVATDGSIDRLAQLGVLLLLFEVGLESTVRDLLAVGAAAARVAVFGTIGSFAFGLGCAELALHGAPLGTRVFVAASITATSIGITARVFKDLGLARSVEARTILGAAVLDDVLGLVILALVTGWLRDQGASTTSLALLVGKTIVVLGLAIAIGLKVTPRIFGIVERLRAPGVLLGLGLAFCFFFSWGADKLGLAPIIGAFAAGLVLEEQKALAPLVEPLAHFLVPIFFVVMGARADVRAFADPHTLVLAAALTGAAILGKAVCALGPGRGVDRLAVAIGMMPRGEVTLIYASLGLSLHVIDKNVYSAIVLAVAVTTLVTPTALKWSLRQ